MKAILVHKKFFPQSWLIGEWGYQEEKAILEDRNRSSIECSHREQEAVENVKLFVSFYGVEQNPQRGKPRSGCDGYYGRWRNSRTGDEVEFFLTGDFSASIRDALVSFKENDLSENSFSPVKCKQCGERLYWKELLNNNYFCNKCKRERDQGDKAQGQPSHSRRFIVE